MIHLVHACLMANFLSQTIGQFVVEEHGNIYEKDIHEMKPWEKELERRGLVIKEPEEEGTADKA